MEKYDFRKLKEKIIHLNSIIIFNLLIFNYSIFLIYFLIILGVLSILEFIQLSKKIFNNRTGLILINFSLYFTFFAFCYMFFSFQTSRVKILLYIFLLGCIASDIGGFIFEYFPRTKIN